MESNNRVKTGAKRSQLRGQEGGLSGTSDFFPVLFCEGTDSIPVLADLSGRVGLYTCLGEYTGEMEVEMKWDCFIF